jgi:formamidopyrimidine-DNA glycosylase
MPELPEVETIVRGLRRSAVGCTVESTRLSGLPLRRPVSGELGEALRGRTILDVHRRGKYILFETEPRGFFLVHLGMSGRLLHFDSGGKSAAHTHAVVRFTDSSELQYRDPRRFGLLSFHEVDCVEEIPEIGRLGIDPLDRGLTAFWLRTRTVVSAQPIKSFLLDQATIAGLGNIYVLEALFLAGIRPSRRCRTLNPDEVSRLVRAIRSVIRAAVHHRGTSFSDFMGADGKPGEHQRFLRVFQREGGKCRRCGGMIVREIQGNRSSFYCPGCQR